MMSPIEVEIPEEELISLKNRQQPSRANYHCSQLSSYFYLFLFHLNWASCLLVERRNWLDYRGSNF